MRQLYEAAMRLSQIDRADLTERQRETYDRIAQGPRKAVRGPFSAWIRSPIFADRADEMGLYLRFQSPLPDDVKELIILIVAKTWRSAFVWHSHKELALNAGLTEETIEAIQYGRPPQFSDKKEGVVHAVLIELLQHRSISDETWMQAIAALGEQGVVDVLGIAGYYGMVVATVVATNLGDDLPDPFCCGH